MLTPRKKNRIYWNLEGLCLGRYTVFRVVQIRVDIPEETTTVVIAIAVVIIAYLKGWSN